MNRHIALILTLCLLGGTLGAQNPSKRERKKNLVVKEWNLRAGSRTPYLDNVVTYDEQGRKIEEIEYASYGQKKRVTYEYEGESYTSTVYKTPEYRVVGNSYDILINPDKPKEAFDPYSVEAGTGSIVLTAIFLIALPAAISAVAAYFLLLQ